MSRGQLFLVAGGLAATAVLCLVWAASMTPDIRSYVADEYQEYGSDRYACDGTPQQVADELSEYSEPEAWASDRVSEYLRYDDDVAIIGPEGSRPCTVRMEGVDEGYSGGAFIFLGPGFTPGSPAGGAGGSGGGPGSGK